MGWSHLRTVRTPWDQGSASTIAAFQGLFDKLIIRPSLGEGDLARNNLAPAGGHSGKHCS